MRALAFLALLGLAGEAGAGAGARGARVRLGSCRRWLSTWAAAARARVRPPAALARPWGRGTTVGAGAVQSAGCSCALLIHLRPHRAGVAAAGGGPELVEEAVDCNGAAGNWNTAPPGALECSYSVDCAAGHATGERQPGPPLGASSAAACSCTQRPRTAPLPTAGCGCSVAEGSGLVVKSSHLRVPTGGTLPDNCKCRVTNLVRVPSTFSAEFKVQAMCSDSIAP